VVRHTIICYNVKRPPVAEQTGGRKKDGEILDYLNIVLHNKIGVPIYLEVPIPPELLNAIRCSPVTMAEFTIHSKKSHNESKIVTPSTFARSEIGKFKVL